jgi:ATP-dependent RNA helicase DDX27
MRTKRDCQRMYILFRLLGIKIGQLHGNLTQIQRIEALSAFKRQNEVKILCATDLAARGLDIEGVMTVILILSNSSFILYKPIFFRS